jgi:formate dehydrogenase assembly factor FdhD
MTLVGFLRGESMVVYSGAQRIAVNEEAVAP